jgi:hypothetical protein
VTHGPVPIRYWNSSARSVSASVAAVVVGPPFGSSSVTPAPAVRGTTSLASEVMNVNAVFTVSVDSSSPDMRANTAANSSAKGNCAVMPPNLSFHTTT